MYAGDPVGHDAKRRTEPPNRKHPLVRRKEAANLERNINGGDFGGRIYPHNPLGHRALTTAHLKDVPCVRHPSGHHSSKIIQVNKDPSIGFGNAVFKRTEQSPDQRTRAQFGSSFICIKDKSPLQRSRTTSPIGNLAFFANKSSSAITATKEYDAATKTRFATAH